MGSESLSRSIDEASAHGEFGLRSGFRGRLGLPRRVLARILSPLFREQVEFNRRLVEVLNGFAERFGFFERAYDKFQQAADNIEHAIVVAHKRMLLLDEKLELVQRQTYVRDESGINVLKGEVGHARTESASIGAAEKLPESSIEFAKLYAVMEEELRGPESVIKEHAHAYLVDVGRVAGLGPILDLGCGRCEWLKVLRDAGIDAYGVDANELFVGRGVACGLDVRLNDAIEHLRNLPESKLGAITAFHLVEHLEIESLIELLDLCLRALRPGGLLILETPDPENLVVGASSFYLDPTHVRPLPPRLLSVLVAARGFVDVEIREMKREGPLDFSVEGGAPWAEDVTKIWQFVSERIVGPEDYSVIARRG